MTKRRKQGLVLLLVSAPMMWFGFSSFLASGTSSTALAMGIAISCTLGLAFALSGLIMLGTKNSLGILNPDDKGRGEDLLASQTSEDSPIPEDLQQDLVIQNEMKRTYQDSVAQAQKEIINKKQKVKPMAKAETSVDLMKREKKLETRRKELESLLAEVTKEEKAVEKELKSKGWVQQKDGSWSVE